MYLKGNVLAVLCAVVVFLVMLVATKPTEKMIRLGPEMEREAFVKSIESILELVKKKQEDLGAKMPEDVGKDLVETIQYTLEIVKKEQVSDSASIEKNRFQIPEQARKPLMKSIQSTLENIQMVQACNDLLTAVCTFLASYYPRLYKMFCVCFKVEDCNWSKVLD
ncbi:hypothetical protein LOTGIDRAFT_236469 [Lottia gigantea]|uniref:Uncharacterized protein n=1 Tax=Lottia gigantea TaxID=225164 RepID=V3ZMC9_LOTGI|nr:hypothetical protein LOTGIDRAFT_236469 [Lottia gigantea]ESO83605.1 hypothetical protein LOTGIDRAFT_236469 [Lottia gigantea]